MDDLIIAGVGEKGEAGSGTAIKKFNIAKHLCTNDTSYKSNRLTVISPGLSLWSTTPYEGVKSTRTIPTAICHSQDTKRHTIPWGSAVIKQQSERRRP